ncbi:MAG: HDIG domain-containing protein [Candidatus Azobacteroides sp.]|nr:HDIG domain-containing protein [Candidatus Azobacteroides sp.]
MKRKDILTKIILMVISCGLIIYVLPREVKFNYQFQEGKPWKYDFLTASFDFPIYKSEDRLQREQDSLLKTFQPYYKWMDGIAKLQERQFEDNYDRLFAATTPQEYFRYVKSELDKIYSSGVISSDKYSELQKSGTTSVFVVKDNVGKEYPVSQLYTTKRAYEEIVDHAPASLDKNILQSFNINTYLAENLQYDEKMSEGVKEQMLQKISETSGMVQTGEKIVERGEIIDKHTYAVLRSLQISVEKRITSGSESNLILFGQILLVACIMLILPGFLWLFRPEIYRKKTGFTFLLMMITIFCLLNEINASLKLFNVYVIPFAILPIIIRTFFDSRTALTAHIVTIFISSLTAPFSFEFVLLQLAAGIIAVYSLKELSQRSQIFACAIFIFAAYSIIYPAYTLAMEGVWSKINVNMFFYFLINALLVLFTYPLIYLFEKTFGFISGVTLVELSNINQPILRKLSETAPGTFHHSLQVSNLAADAAAGIGANVQLVRTGAIYHDIGKMENPIYFTENQTQGVNPHNGLPYEKSAEIIIKHVSDGLQIASKIGLPQQIVDFIATHHGKGKAKYFYHSFKNQYPDKPVNEEKFTYPGPNPFTKETAILMMADAVEAASRSLPKYTDESISLLVNRIIDSRLEEGLLKNAPLTFKDVETIKEIFISKLKTIYHTRVSYPDLNNK